MAPKRRKKRRKKRAAAPRAQPLRICAPGLSQLLMQPGETSPLKITLGEAVKRLWAYAKARGLQQGRAIRCDETMRRLFGEASLDMFEVSGALSAHMRGAGFERDLIVV